MNEVNNILENLDGNAKEWMDYFVSYMRKHHPDIEEIVSFSIPTYMLSRKPKKNYIAFSFAKNHFSLHTLDFDYIIELKQLLSKSGKGKGCVNVPFEKIEERKILEDAIEKIIERNQ